MSPFTARSNVEKLFGTPLPKEASEIHFHDVRPGSDISFHTAYAKFRVPKDHFDALMTRLHAVRAGEAAAQPYLPAAWELAPDQNPGWWDASADTPPDAWAKPMGFNGWITAKYERGWAYVIATDTGHSEGGR